MIRRPPSSTRKESSAASDVYKRQYICGSSYFMKMMDFKKGDWCNTMDGLYWRFINRNRKFFLKNPRLSMMVRVFDKMKSDRKKLILSEAEKFIVKNTYGN